MSNSASNFRCPVCRARQPLQDECRRCQADLSLVVRAHRRVEYLLCQRADALEARDTVAAGRLAEELALLSPRHGVAEK